MKKILNTDAAPQAIGPYSQGAAANGFLFLSGQIPLTAAGEPQTDKGIEEQTELVLTNIKNLLGASSLDFSDIVKTTIFLTDINDFAAVNEIYAKYFNENPPARSTVAVAALPKGARVEIECVAAVG